jgi:hypothetical protein
MTTRALTAQRTPEPVMKRQVSQQPATPDRDGNVRVGVYVRRSTDDGHQPSSGMHSQRKALFEALVAQVKIAGPGRIVPVFRIPQATRREHSETNSKVSGVRAMTNLVELRGLEPLTPCLQSRCSTS